MTVTFDTDPGMPETGMVEGYGLAAPLWFGEPVAGIAIEVVLLNVVGTAAMACGGIPSRAPTLSTAASASAKGWSLVCESLRRVIAVIRLSACRGRRARLHAACSQNTA